MCHIVKFRSSTRTGSYVLYRRYERLQSEMDKTNDKSLAKELSALEKELNAKEEEINAVVGLYKEVRAIIEYVMYFAGKRPLFSMTLQKPGDGPEAANENAAREKQSGLRRLGQGNVQGCLSLVDYTRKAAFDKSGAGLRSEKNLQRDTGTARFYAAGCVITADSDFS